MLLKFAGIKKDSSRSIPLEFSCAFMNPKKARNSSMAARTCLGLTPQGMAALELKHEGLSGIGVHASFSSSVILAFLPWITKQYRLKQNQARSIARQFEVAE
jgi:hypothetical protein